MHQDELTDDEINEVLSYIPNAYGYYPYSADYVKDSYIDVKNNPDFWKLYFSLMVRYPVNYIEAWLRNTQGLWYIWDTTSTITYGSWITYNGGVGYLVTILTQELLDTGISYQPKFPELMYFCESLVNGNSYYEIPVIRVIFSMALYFWLSLLALVLAIINRSKRFILLFVFVFAYIAGLLFCPVVLVRYCFPFICCLPVLFRCVFTGAEVK